MRNIILITCSLVFVNSITAQDYIPFPDSVATWNIVLTTYSMDSEGWWQEHGDGYNYRLEGDTLINDTLYSKLFLRKSWASYSLIGPNATSWENNYELSQYQFIGGIREDVDKQVWYRNMNYVYWGNDSSPLPWYAGPTLSESFENAFISNPELLLYDFGLEVGDSIYFGNDCVFGGTWRVLEEITLDDLGRRNFIFTLGNNGVCEENYLVWVEGIGNINAGLFSLYDVNNAVGLGFNIVKGLACFWQNGEQVYTNPDDSYMENCEGLIILGIDEIENQSLEIYPNPSAEVFNIILPVYEKSNIAVFNSLGKEIFNEMDVYGELFEVDLGAYPVGLYLVQLTMGSNGIGPSTGSGTYQSYSAKIVKE